MGTYDQKLPWYYMYAANLIADQRYRLMTLDERGLFLTLQNECWVNDSLPSDNDVLAQLLGQPEAALTSALTNRVTSFFSIHNGHLTSPELDRYKATHLERRWKQRLGGQKGAAIRKRNAAGNSQSEAEGGPTGGPPGPLNQFDLRSLNSTSVYKEGTTLSIDSDWVRDYDDASGTI